VRLLGLVLFEMGTRKAIDEETGKEKPAV